MIRNILIKNFGPVEHLSIEGLQNINLLIGHNGSGKTFIMKALYAAQKSAEDYKRGKNPYSIKEIIKNKLFWVFQPNNLGDIVCKSSSKHGPLSFSMTNDKGERLTYGFSSSATNSIVNLTSNIAPSEKNCIFIPAKEVLSILDSIIKSREQDKDFGFDDTYLDLARVLRPSIQGKMATDFTAARKKLSDAIGGKLYWDSEKNDWKFKDKKSRVYSIMLTSEGIKKISVLDSLLGSRYIKPGSIVFIDEIEANLHPEMISKFIDIIALLAKNGIQFFITTHSYFVIKNLFLLAQKGKKQSIPVLSFTEEGVDISDLKDDMPQNPIVEESVRLYRKELGLE